MARRKVATNPARADKESQAITDEILRCADLPTIAAQLGIAVTRGTRDSKAVCPFHDDHKPSLNFYKRGDRWHFKCFACGEGGDVFDLVARIQKTDFLHAREWIANQTGVQLPAGTRSSQRDLQREGLEIARQIYSAHSGSEQLRFRQWAESRGFDLSFLERAGLRFASNDKISKHLLLGNSSRDDAEALLRAGLLRHGKDELPPDAQRRLPLVYQPADHFFGDRVIIPIENSDGRLVGFAGRSVGSTEPKYLYTRELPKGKLLYGWRRVEAGIGSTRRAKFIPDETGDHNIYLVEGFFDALRLETRGLAALAVLGSEASPQQVTLILDLVRKLEEAGRRLVLSIFFDFDDAGRRGASRTLVRILKEAAALANPWEIRVVANETGFGTAANDPDELLREMAATGSDEVRRGIAKISVSPIRFLVAETLGCRPSALQAGLKALAPSRYSQIFRQIERLVGDRQVWKTLLEREFPLFEISEPAPELTDDYVQSFERKLRDYLAATVKKAPDRELARDAPSIELSERARFVHAISLARASTQRREFPVDDDGWLRIETGLGVFLHFFKSRLQRLQRGAPPLSEPMVAVHIPKGGGNFRLKALPCNEDLALQQYMLNELLRSHDSDGFVSSIPAVRYYHSAPPSRRLQTTGVLGRAPSGGKTLSFAYQVDMDVLEGRAPPRGDGLFRPWKECWSEFIGHIQRRAHRFQSERIYVDRVDIRRFYDSLPRFAVNQALAVPLEIALRSLSESSPNAFAPWFLEDERESRTSHPSSDADRKGLAESCVNWLCDMSFGYAYYDPGTGAVKHSGAHQAGVPQGPDLSAYLANVSLFGLDVRVGERLAEMNRRASDGGESAASAAYARYVDDMVIAASSDQDLRVLRREIGARLAEIGLELSPKTDPLPPMRIEEFDEWLTSQRGAGLTVSDSEGTTLLVDQIWPYENAIDDIDRPAVLRMLFDATLDQSKTDAEELIVVIKRALDAPNLRHGDVVSAASRLWQAVASESKSVVGAAAAATWVIDHWPPVAAMEVPLGAGQGGTSSSSAASRMLYLLEGLERYLRHTPSDFRLGIDGAAKIEEQRMRIAKWCVLDSLADVVQKKIEERLLAAGVAADCLQTEVGHTVRLRKLAIECVSVRLFSPTASPVQRAQVANLITGGDSPTGAELRLQFARAVASRRPLEEVAHLQFSYDDRDPFLLLIHEAVARLMLHEINAAVVSADPLAPMIDRVNGISTTEQHPLAKVLKLWMPDQ